MRAAYIDEFGPAEAIRFGELPTPVPRPGEVLVRVAATTANHVDTFVRSGSLPVVDSFPFIVGRDLIGTVEDAGSLVTDFSVGDCGRQGTAAEFAAVPGNFTDRAFC